MLAAVGPWDSIDQAKEQLNAQWKQSLNGVGVLFKGRSMSHNVQDVNTGQPISINRRSLYCSQHAKTDCKFQIILQQNQSGQWEISSVGPDCNHAQPSTPAEQNVFASHRGIPGDLLQEGIKLRKNGARTAFVYKYLSNLCFEQTGKEPCFNYQDVFHGINPHKDQTTMDSTGFVQYLQSRKDENGLDFAWISDDDGSIMKAFFVFKHAVKIFSDGSRPVLFDTKHGSNRYGLRLGVFSTVGRDGSTVLLAAALLSNEDTESFKWAFTQFQHAFGRPPHCIFTDGDKAMAAALRDTWPETKHFLCTWHLSQNIIKNTKGEQPALYSTTTAFGCTPTFCTVQHHHYHLWVYTHSLHCITDTTAPPPTTLWVYTHSHCTAPPLPPSLDYGCTPTFCTVQHHHYHLWVYTHSLHCITDTTAPPPTTLWVYTHSHCTAPPLPPSLDYGCTPTFCTVQHHHYHLWVYTHNLHCITDTAHRLSRMVFWTRIGQSILQILWFLVGNLQKF